MCVALGTCARKPRRRSSRCRVASSDVARIRCTAASQRRLGSPEGACARRLGTRRPHRSLHGQFCSRRRDACSPRVDVRCAFVTRPARTGTVASSALTSIPCLLYHAWRLAPCARRTLCTAQACKTGFTFTRRKHHCRRCGGVFCNECSMGRSPIPCWAIDADVRVCAKCLHMIQVDAEADGEKS